MNENKIKPDIRHYLCGAVWFATFTCQAEGNLYSINTGSYVYHLTHNHGQYTEHFEAFAAQNGQGLSNLLEANPGVDPFLPNPAPGW
jgi:hypothetical protein